MSMAVIVGALAAYMAILFAVAWAAERGLFRAGRLTPFGPRLTQIIYALSLAVYCTSWTFYGAVGSAAGAGWEYLAIYLGPVLVFTLGLPIVRKLIAAGKQQNTTSISDFISARYGRSRSLAALITLIATAGTIPYIALQLRSVSFTLSEVSGVPFSGGLTDMFLIAGFLALFAILFGTRHLDITAHNRGMITAIAFESLIKLLAFVAVGILAALMLNREASVPPAENPFLNAPDSGRFLTLTLLSMGAILALPRQFHVTVVECQTPRRIGPAAGLFVLYLAVISALVLPITMAGLSHTEGSDPDYFVLALPAAEGLGSLSLFTFLGGFAAATGMIIVSGVALSTMITNDLLVPLYLRFRNETARDGQTIARPLLAMRRLTILLLLMIAAIFAGLAPDNLNLASFGTLSFAAAAQFIPALIAGLYWSRGTATGVRSGLIAGLAIWAVFLLHPLLSDTGGLAALIFPPGWDTLTAGSFFSLGINLALFVAISLRQAPNLAERLQAAYFINLDTEPTTSRMRGETVQQITSGDLLVILEKCLTPSAAREALADYEQKSGTSLKPSEPVPAAFVRHAERRVARTLGASSARILMTSALAGRGVGTTEMVQLLDETAQILQFNQELLQTTLENIPQGVSVVDAEMRLVAWNSAYQKMFDYPEGFLSAGMPVEEILTFNAGRGEFGPPPHEEQIARRLHHLRLGTPHVFERQRRNGKVIKIQGRQVPGGGYVTTFSDVTDYKEIETALRENERRTRFYTDNIPFPIAFTDTSEVIQFSNAAYREIFGNRAARLRGRKVAEVLPPSVYEERRPFMKRALAGERVSFETEINYRYKPVRMEVSYVPKLDEYGSITGFFGLYQDVTKRVEAERALRETNETLEDRVRVRTSELQTLNQALETAREDAMEATRSKTRFLAAASHDVLQPLNAARLFTSALAGELEKTGHDALPLAGKVEQAIKSADLLLKTLLNITRLDAGGITPQNSVFSIGNLLQEIVDEFAPVAAEKGLSLRVVHSSMIVETDRGLVRSVLQNLVSNAIRYTSQGRILAGVRRCGDSLSLEVWDTGIGIPEHRQRDIFREFERLNSGGDGLGLGLATVERICRLLGHDISVNSEPGKGSVFRMRMDRSDKSALSPPSFEATTVRGPARSETRKLPEQLDGIEILCADNDLSVLEAMDAMLRQWGARPILARSLAEVQEIYECGHAFPALALLDYHLDHGETGPDIHQYLCEAAGRHIPAALITAEDSGYNLTLARERSLKIFRKPADPAALRQFIEQTVHTSVN